MNLNWFAFFIYYLSKIFITIKIYFIFFILSVGGTYIK